MLLGIIDPDGGERRILGSADPLAVAPLVGYLPEERGLYPGMNAREAIAFMGALRGLPLAEGRRRATALLADHGLPADRPIRTLSKGMAQLVQLLGTIVHGPRLIVLDEPFSGLDAINQQRLEGLIRAQAANGATILFSTHVIAHAERLCERIAIIAGGEVRFEGEIAEARGRLPSRVRLATKVAEGAWRAALPADAVLRDGTWLFELPRGGIEPLLAAIIEADAGIETLAIEPPSLHEAFVAIVGAQVDAEPEAEPAA
jgi:ABC-2 type transport system ATP-binding protein